MTEPVRLCVLESCGKPLVRKPGERARRWNARDYCDRACYRALRAAGLKPNGFVPAVAETKPCAECGNTMRPRPDERTNRWRDRLTCGRSCASKRKSRRAAETKAEMRKAKAATEPVVARPSRPSVPLVEKECKGCGSVMTPPEGVRPANWRMKRYCTPSCASQSTAAARTTTPPPPVAAPVGPRTVWRPVGLSRIPNQWAGHRPPVDEEVSA